MLSLFNFVNLATELLLTRLGTKVTTESHQYKTYESVAAFLHLLFHIPI